ncbi:Ig-like domain-containing protein [Geothrix sp. PMB-07]|uniref:Ig-like domain-containing protein n=1 Tax=Geothrix sp. PMB-07 TaxID=3068640 RepID=UPI0027413EEF|nr:Ig-like domain-containing protein [Geothrix sp. PMB-07]WLT31442.1 Ig-like domain-containing protein [Geothrix sp. PMB-07]
MMLRRFLPLVLVLLPMFLGCFGTNKSSDRAGTVNGNMTILPEAPSLLPGQTVQFSAGTPWGQEVTWSVLPASAGTISTTGLFTASATPGAATVFAVWTKDVRYTASTGVSVLPPPAPAEISPNLTQASGAQQVVTGTDTTNAAVVGETVPSVTAVSVNGAIKVRHGFNPPVK